MITEYAFETPTGKFTTEHNDNAPGSASWCETYADNH
jgi:hypothetical protein